MAKTIKIQEDQLTTLLDETHKISNKNNNGILKFLAKTNKKGYFRYSLTYINANIFSGDNGRVLGFDNDHGYHHRHYMGKEERIDFVSFEEIKKRFESEWREIHEKNQK